MSVVTYLKALAVGLLITTVIIMADIIGRLLY